MSIIFHKAVFSLLTLPLLSLFSHAHFEQKMVSVNATNKNVTLTLFHFNNATQKTSVLAVSDNVGSTVSKQQGSAAISISPNSGISAKKGKISFAKNAHFLIQNNTALPSADSQGFGKHTFILSRGNNQYTLGYAPFISKTQLVHALLQYRKSHKINIHSAILLKTGNSCSFYKANGEYHPYYLKELTPAKLLLMVK